jgi:hypothetical protein
MPRKRKKSARRRRFEKLVYQYTHKDYKTKVDGKPSVLVLRRGGTTLVPVEELTNREIVSHLPRKYITYRSNS